MDKISELTVDLLLRILSFVPTKVVFDAQVVCKRWRNFWKLMPRLYYDYTSHKSESQFYTFIHRTMDLLVSPILQSLYVRVSPAETSVGVVLRKDLLARRLVRELYLVSTNPNRTSLKRGIYEFQTLEILRLQSFTLEDDYGITILLNSLKVLHLSLVKYTNDECLSNLLSSLLSLQDLILDRCLSFKTPTTLSIAVPCLRRLTFIRSPEYCLESLMMLNVNVPSLRYLNIEDHWRNVHFSDVGMENLIQADVNVVHIDTGKLLRTLISVKRLSLCLIILKIPRVDRFFNQLVCLDLCTCQPEWWNVLETVLLASPKLRDLKLHQKHSFGIVDPSVRWKEPSFVPECFASHLETFEWRGYEGTEDEKELVSYILKNARILKTTTIYPVISNRDETMHWIFKQMRTELEYLSRCCFTCELVFR